MPCSCAFGCKPTAGVAMHRFPSQEKFPERFKTWVTLCGGQLETSADYYNNYKEKRICDRHFVEKDHNRNKRLNALAVPSLYLAETRGERVEEPGTLNVTMQLQDTGQVTVPPTSKELPPSDKNKILKLRKWDECKRTNIATQQMDVDQILDVQSTPQILPPSGPKRATVRKSNVNNETQKNIRKLKLEIIKLRKRCHYFKTRVEKAEKLSNSLAAILHKVITGKYVEIR